jgi:hypothetical protein
MYQRLGAPCFSHNYTTNRSCSHILPEVVNLVCASMPCPHACMVAETYDPAFVSAMRAARPPELVKLVLSSTIWYIYKLEAVSERYWSLLRPLNDPRACLRRASLRHSDTYIATMITSSSEGYQESVMQAWKLILLLL